MTFTWTKSNRRLAAVLILCLVVFLLFLIVVKPILTLPFDRRAELNALGHEVARLREEVAQRPALEDRRLRAERWLGTEQVLWKGIGYVQIGSAIQDAIRGAALQSHGQVISTSPETKDTEDGEPRIVVRARIEGSIETLQHVLASLAEQRPRLYVDTLSVTSPQGGSTHERAQQLSFELVLSAFLDDRGNYESHK